MTCPYCNKKMKSGTIEADNLLSWTPDGETRSGVTRWATSPNAIKLADLGVFSRSVVKAFYCTDCKKIIIDAP